MIESPQQFFIRQAGPEDAESVSRLAREFAQYLRSIGDVVDFELTAEAFLRDGFGPEPAFSGLVAETHREMIGYCLYYPGFDIDYGVRILHIADLYVQEDWRRQGVGRALMAEASNVCRGLGGTQLFWAVYVHNKIALAFYENLGARLTRDLAFMRLDI